MTDRPYVLLSVAASIDGYIDDATDERLLLSNDVDFDRVDEVRASADAILVGATTVRRDNPRLLVRSESRRAARRERAETDSPIKIVLTGSGDLDPDSKFFTTGDIDKIVYAATPATEKARERVGDVATVVDANDPLDLGVVLDDLAARGVRRLMVEGGSSIHTQFLTADLADELHLVVAPFFVGDPAAPSFVNAGEFPQSKSNRMTLAEVRQIDDVVLLVYRPAHVT